MIEFSLIVLYETWLTADVDYGFTLPGYEHINVYRNNFGGGIKILYQSKFNIEVLNDLTFVCDIMEVLTFILCGKNFRYVICSLYRPPSSNSNLFNVMLIERILSKLKTSDKIIVIGDVNLNLFNPLKLKYIDDFINNMLSMSFFPIVTLPTKYNDGNLITPFSLIDQIWSNFMPVGNCTAGVDHYPIYYLFEMIDKLEVKHIKFRLFKNGSLIDFVNEVRTYPFFELFIHDNLNENFKGFYDKLFYIYNKHFPIKKKLLRKKNNRAPWMTHELKICYKKKYHLFNLLKRGVIQKRQFNIFKNTQAYVTRKIKNVYYARKFSECENARDSWSNINELLKRKKTRSSI